MFNHHFLIPWESFRGRQEEKWGSFRGRFKIVLHVQELCWDDDERHAYTNHPLPYKIASSLCHTDREEIWNELKSLFLSRPQPVFNKLSFNF